MPYSIILLGKCQKKNPPCLQTNVTKMRVQPSKIAFLQCSELFDTRPTSSDRSSCTLDHDIKQAFLLLQIAKADFFIVKFTSSIIVFKCHFFIKGHFKNKYWQDSTTKNTKVYIEGFLTAHLFPSPLIVKHFKIEFQICCDIKFWMSLCAVT